MSAWVLSSGAEGIDFQLHQLYLYVIHEVPDSVSHVFMVCTNPCFSMRSTGYVNTQL